VSKRFYEGLSPADVEGVTLVVEPQANPAILDAYPGRIRCLGEEVLDVLLGEHLFRPMDRLPKGATVAHLAYYLARHLGCDPVLLAGQDLGFTDGQYYAAGAQIHQVWASELNPFRSLEMFEWERVKRMGGALRKAKDASGEDIYTDEQMATYLVQFERDFLADKERGLKTFDATEGGVAKAHTVDITLARGLETFATSPIRWKPGVVDGWTRTPPSRERIDAVLKRLREVRRDVLGMEKITVETRSILETILEKHADQARVNALIGKVEANRDRATGLRTAFWLTQFMNQAGSLRRFKADRAIDIAGSIDEMGRQRLQIERDLENMKALRESSEMVGTIVEDALTAMSGGTKALRPSFQREADAGRRSVAGPASGRAIAAVIIADPDWSGMGTTRDLGTPIAGDNALRWTLRTLAKTSSLRRVILATDQPDRIRALIGDCPPGLTLTIERVDLTEWHAQRRYRFGGRAWSRHAWRGGPAGLSVYDEAVEPVVLDSICRSHRLDAGRERRSRLGAARSKARRRGHSAALGEPGASQDRVRPRGTRTRDDAPGAGKPSPTWRPAAGASGSSRRPRGCSGTSRSRRSLIPSQGPTAWWRRRRCGTPRSGASPTRPRRPGLCRMCWRSLARACRRNAHLRRSRRAHGPLIRPNTSFSS
jgi:hypothetical protein